MTREMRAQMYNIMIVMVTTQLTTSKNTRHLKGKTDDRKHRDNKGGDTPGYLLDMGREV